MARGRPKGAKNKPKTAAAKSPKKPAVPLISNEEQFDNLNKEEVR